MRVKRKIPVKKKRNAFLSTRKKFCRFCVNKVKTIDYKDIKIMEGFVRERGKILSRRISGNCTKHQRGLMEAIKRARFLSLIPYARAI
ncbi:MAG: 30S ribosomal protein S18 [Candidatus Omnitrophica bacterium]|nr:30S ribosomal protein S18 [Nitrospirota bacterium]MBU4345727.1 30S ribosomal protein S18 [Candidatus Omnitrophota bacterium]MBU4473144.1 30S ribosomal protein S18 [Candidatus Omnitrophota bacterium]MCG2706431.1 30S ribosomal protein S18 [Candidatus Omnitrophota bacterium]